MAEMRNPPLRGSGIAAGPVMTVSGLSREREYKIISDGVRSTRNPSPREVVARLHERMAQMPEYAALVAVCDDVKAGRREPLTAAEIRRELGPPPRMESCNGEH